MKDSFKSFFLFIFGPNIEKRYTINSVIQRPWKKTRKKALVAESF